jgi:ERO1-like protein alpha
VGTALKILLLPDRLIASTIQREEVVALLNTVGKFSQAIDGIKNLQVVAHSHSPF